MTAANEQTLKDLKDLSDKVEGLTSSVASVVKSLEGYTTTDDIGTILQALDSDRKMLELRLRVLSSRAGQHVLRQEELNGLRDMFTRLERSFIDSRTKLTLRLEEIERKQSTDSGRIDDVETNTNEALRIAKEALRVARDAQTTAGNAKAEVDSLGGRVTTAENWLYGSLGSQPDGSSQVLTDINERLDRHDATLNEFGERFEAIRVALADIWKQLRSGGFSSPWTLILLIIGGIVGWLFGEGLYGTVFTTIFGLAIGATAGYVVDLIMNRRKSKKGVYRKSTPRTNQSANTTKETSA